MACSLDASTRAGSLPVASSSIYRQPASSSGLGAIGACIGGGCAVASGGSRTGPIYRYRLDVLAGISSCRLAALLNGGLPKIYPGPQFLSQQRAAFIYTMCALWLPRTEVCLDRRIWYL